jgi:sterol-4alpha-carboxylate 3-dehydrogenase (decarboxylating)
MASQKKTDLGRVLVIGGCGFLGHHVVNQLVDKYTASVSVIDLRCIRNRRPESDGVKYFDADITDSGRLQSIFEEIKPDVVIHTASPPAQASVSVTHELFRKVNVDGTQAVVGACKSTGVKALVFTSSASVMSDNVSDLINADERWPVIRGEKQTEYYSETKVCTTSLTNLITQTKVASLV